MVRWIVPALLSISVTACDGMLSFRGQSDTQSSGPQDMSPPEGSDANPSGNDATLACFSARATSPARRPQRLVIPSRCQRHYVGGNVPTRTLDVMFALDVTGSMRNELAAVRAGVESLGMMVAREGWQLRAGAVAFADEVLEEQAPLGDLGTLWSSMSPDGDIWSAPDGFGGDAPEVGLAAIEKGVDLLRGADPGFEVGEKILVYVSDAPARRIHRGSFDITETSRRLAAFASEARASGRSSFRFFFSSSTSRKGLMDEFPTPIVQMEALAQASGVFATRLPFPLDTQGVASGFLERLRQEALLTETCELEKVVVHDARRQARVIDAQASHKESWWTSQVPETMEPGSYSINLARNCSHAGKEEDKAQLEILE